MVSNHKEIIMVDKEIIIAIIGLIGAIVAAVISGYFYIKKKDKSKV